MTQTPYQQFLSKPEISFWVPMIFTAVSIVTSFLLLANKVDLLTERVNLLLNNQNSIVSDYKGVQVRLDTAEKDITALQVKANLK